MTMNTEKTKPRPKWHPGARFERKTEFTVNGPAAEVFPLLCPVLEYVWIPDWRCTMYYSDSGVAEKDCIFHTTEAPGKKAVWTCITYEPDTLIEYLIVSGRDAVVRLSLRLEETGKDRTRLYWRMLFTGTAHLGKAVIKKAYSEKSFREMTAERERQLNAYFAAGTGD